MAGPILSSCWRLIFWALVSAAPALGQVAALPAAHAHNDYEHPRPLFDALDQGFGSIEADIHLVDGRLLVGHDKKSLRPERTLAGLYLDPLLARVQAHGGRVYRGGPTITLLVDVKTEAVATYAALHATLGRYAAMLTVFRDGMAAPGAITVILSGNRARAEVAAQPLRYVAIDGRLDDLTANPPTSLVPWVSENWQKVFTWKWTGPMPDADRTKLRELVTLAHAQHRRLRFWNTPDTPAAWRLLHEAGVDLINTDQLAALAGFLRSTPAAPETRL